MHKRAEEAIDCLEQAKIILVNRGWVGGPGCQASEAKTNVGRICRADSLTATKFTIMGACKRAGGNWVEAVSWLKLLGSKLHSAPTLFELNTQKLKSAEDAIRHIEVTIAHIKHVNT